MLLCGVQVDDRLVLALAGVMQHSALSQKLHVAATLKWPVVNLTGAEHQTVLATLDNSPTGLEGLRELFATSPGR